MNTIIVKEDRRGEVHRHTRTIDFEGATPQEHHLWTHRGKPFIPVSATTSWDHGKPSETITAQGPLLKKDGTPGETVVSTTYVTPASREWGDTRSWNRPDAPAWLLELFGIEAPKPEG